MKFQLIVSDPPWSFNDELTMSDTARGASSNYNTLSNKDIINLDIKSLADPNGAILVLWVPSSLLDVGLEAMKNYGFVLKQSYVWVKIKKDPFAKLVKSFRKVIKNNTNIKILINELKVSLSDYLYDIGNNILDFGMGRLFRQTHEIALIGINNKKIYKHLKNKSQRSVSFYYNDEHSKKPEHLQDSLDIMFPDIENKLEIFARRDRQGYICIGNEAPKTLKEDIRVSIDNLIKK